jgi:DNA-binding CsgD family transcriptional regulator
MIEAMLTLLREGWGQDLPAYRMMFTSRFMPEATTEQMKWFNDLQRASANGENAARQQLVGANVDVLDRLSSISVPTLVMHANHDPAIPFNEGRQIAAIVPDAHFVELTSNNHLTLADEPAWTELMGNIRNFMAYNRPLAKESIQGSAPRTAPGGLTEREIEVLRLVAAGRSNREIADELVISINTVTNHVKSILGKTQSANRTEASLFAYRHKLASAQ